MSNEAAAAGTIQVGDFEVNRMGFGAMRITGEGIWGAHPDVDRCKATLRRALELGCNFIDTADSYGPHISEELIAETLHPYPDGLMIATKGGFTRPGPNRWVADGRPEHLREACEGSLKRLKVETIDLYQHHTIDKNVPLEESLGAIKELQDEGKIRHIGLSNYYKSEDLERARAVVDFVSVQNRYAPTVRDREDALHVCEERSLAFIPWRPIEAGGLNDAGSPLVRLADEKGATPVQIALAWLLHRSKVMLPIPGTSSPEHLEENVAAASISLTEDEFNQI